MAKDEQIIRFCFWSVIIGVIGLASIPLPHGLPGPRNSKDLSNAKQIYFGLKMYAGDHDGEFPSTLSDGSPITTANQAFRALIPEYIPKETRFYAEGSAWTPKEPDDDIEGDRKLAAGENAFAYVPNLTDISDPNFPLVATGFSERKPGVYGDDPALKGGIAEGNGIVYVCVDGSGRLLPVKRKGPSGPAPQSRLSGDRTRAYGNRYSTGGSADWYRLVEREDGPGFVVKKNDEDLFQPAPGWLEPNQVPLNPE